MGMNMEKMQDMADHMPGIATPAFYEIEDAEVRATTPMKTVEDYVCDTCGGPVVQDAWAQWDAENQKMELVDWFDEAFCRACDGSATIKTVEIEVPA